MKIVFLDFDGVLNCRRFLDECKRAGDRRTNRLDPLAVRALNRIVEDTGAEVVITSTWRTFFGKPRLQTLLRNAGFAGIVRGVTPEKGDRGAEIRAWLSAHPDVEAFIVLDDNHVNGVDGRLVRTDMHSGLMPVHANRAIELLEGEA